MHNNRVILNQMVYFIIIKVTYNIIKDLKIRDYVFLFL